MSLQATVNDSVHWFIAELTSRIVAESGIPTDRFHIGKLILQSLKDAPDFISQINGATDESETNRSVLERSVKCATVFRNICLQQGDVIVLMAPNHLDLVIPLYAALYLGVIIAAVDRTLTVREQCVAFAISKPKIIFCQSEKAAEVQLALNEINLNATVVTFDEGGDVCNFSYFLEKYYGEISVDDFKPTDFNPEDTIAFIVATSGTIGLPKAAISTHKNICVSLPYIWSRSTKFPGPTRLALICSPIQWLSSIMNIVLSPLLRYTRLQTSRPMVQEHAFHLLKNYKPSFTIISPLLMASLLKSEGHDECDFSCFERIIIGGSVVPNDLIKKLKKVSPKTEVLTGFGLTETTGIALHADNSVLGSCGKPMGCHEYRLIDIEILKDITDPNVPGELWLKGPAIFKGYYHNPEASAEAFAEDHWFKSGDLFYRDQNWNLFFVERIKAMIKYRNHKISPVEVENVIRQYPGVLDVAVIGIPDFECTELAVACVVRRPGYTVTAQNIKDLVKESLPDWKHLYGGVSFVNELPMTANMKLHIKKLKEMVLQLNRE